MNPDFDKGKPQRGRLFLERLAMDMSADSAQNRKQFRPQEMLVPPRLPDRDTDVTQGKEFAVLCVRDPLTKRPQKNVALAIIAYARNTCKEECEHLGGWVCKECVIRNANSSIFCCWSANRTLSSHFFVHYSVIVAYIF